MTIRGSRLAGLGPLLLIAGCVAAGADKAEVAVEPAEAEAAAEAPQPRLATYRCDDDSSLTIENSGTAVRVSAADGEALDLPAAPPGQTSRYGHTSYALVLDGPEALYMNGNREPLTCRR